MLATALAIVRDEGADRLTLGQLAVRAKISKPVVYDHFQTRSALLIALYEWIDAERIRAFRDAMAVGERTREETIGLLASAYLRCASDMTGEFHVVGAALAGSDQKAIYQTLLDRSVEMFVAVLEPFDTFPDRELERRCIGLVGSGEALSAAMVRGLLGDADAITVYASLIAGGLAP
ncbi:TetR/AcrR family transcriptional regulator [Aureimonas leprariae]|uniref:TetR/AcrR family transcriptional regulator n=1 Tax=Plantimonas leprariae TaxID=2615207 RepID=A0A7V7TXN0_9HYPH|nr:TetR/AcrR family transcriptional regulator [Aureimonas leprariae]